MNVLDEFKKYEREFIQLSPKTMMLINIFSKEDDDFEDIMLSDHEEYYIKTHGTNIYANAADQLFKQFEGHECIYFVRCLRDKCDEIIKKHEEKCKEFAQKLQDKRTKNK